MANRIESFRTQATEAAVATLEWCGNKYLNWVDLTSEYVVDLNTRLAIDEDDDKTPLKVAKLFFTFIATIVLSPVTALVYAYHVIKNYVKAPTKPEGTVPEETELRRV